MLMRLTRTRSLALATASLLVSFSPALLASSSAAHTRQETESSRGESVEDLARSSRRILHLRSGMTFAAVARLKGETWQFKQKGTWVELPASQVLRAPKESDVKRELKAVRKRAANSISGRLSVAHWCVQEGLRQAAMIEIDKILDLRPHHAETLQLLNEGSLIRVPSIGDAEQAQSEQVTNLLKYGSNAPRAARELVLEELRKVEDQPALHGRLLEGLGDNTLRQRSFSAHGLGRLFPGQDSLRLMQHAVLDTSGEVRRAASEALGAANQPDLIAPVVRALSSANPRVRLQSAQALGYMGYATAVEPLINYIATAAAASIADQPIPKGYIFTGRQRAYIQDFDVEVATFQAVADPQINILLEGQVLEAGVAGSSEYSFATQSRYARTSLQRITGLDAGNTGRDWIKWWEKSGAKWKVAALGPE